MPYYIHGIINLNKWAGLAYVPIKTGGGNVGMEGSVNRGIIFNGPFI